MSQQPAAMPHTSVDMEHSHDALCSNCRANIAAEADVLALDDYMSIDELVAHLRNTVSAGTLRNWRTQRKGPRYVNFERSVAYPKREVAAWMAQCDAASLAHWEDRT